MIPDPAVEAARKSVMRSLGGPYLTYEQIARAALEAAAPLIEEAAYSRGFDDGHRAGQESMETE